MHMNTKATGKLQQIKEGENKWDQICIYTERDGTKTLLRKIYLQSMLILHGEMLLKTKPPIQKKTIGFIHWRNGMALRKNR